MLQGFYYLARRRQRLRRAALFLAVLSAAGSVWCAALLRPSAAPASAPADAVRLIASVDDGGRLIVRRADATEPLLQTEIDTRSLPEADRARLSRGVPLTSTQQLSRLLQDYGS